jgi:hypothetical protein
MGWRGDGCCPKPPTLPANEYVLVADDDGQACLELAGEETVAHLALRLEAAMGLPTVGPSVRFTNPGGGCSDLNDRCHRAKVWPIGSNPNGVHQRIAAIGLKLTGLSLGEAMMKHKSRGVGKVHAAHLKWSAFLPGGAK